MKQSLYKYRNILSVGVLIIFFVMEYLSILIQEGVSVRMFDLRMFTGYDFNYATTFLSEISEKGKNIYLWVQLPLDFIFPLFIAAFFSIFFYEKTKRKEMVFLGFAPMIFDYTENILIIIMLTTVNLTPSIVQIASIATIIKGILYTVNIIYTIILYVRSRKQKALEQAAQKTHISVRGDFMDILKHNRKAWDKQVEGKNIWTVPVDHETIEKARLGEFALLLTPKIPVPMDWFGDIKGKKVLCLASGGGQQAPVLAAAGAHVTLLDNSRNQLKQDEYVAQREDLNIRIIQGDMRDLSLFKDETFDLIFHPVSNLFVDDVNKVWKEAYRILKKQGRLLAGYCNPVLFIFDYAEWEKSKELVLRYKIPYSDLEQLPIEELENRIKDEDPLEFGHSLDDQIGGQIKVGFTIHGFYEDQFGGEFLDDHIKTFIATLAIK